MSATHCCEVPQLVTDAKIGGSTFAVLYLSLCFFKIELIFHYNNKIIITSSWWYQNMKAGGSGLNRMLQVRLMVLPLSTCRSGPPNIVAVGTVGNILYLKSAQSQTIKYTENNQLTHYVQINKIASNRLSGHLAFVHSSVPLLSPFYVQSPFSEVFMVCGLKTLIRRVCVTAHR